MESRIMTLDPPAVDEYLQRIGLDPERVRSAELDYDTLRCLQTAHGKHVPFENLSVVGDPFGEGRGPGVSLDIDTLYEKIVIEERGGYCFELNGLFTTLLASLGFEVHRAAAMILPSDGEPSIPANHHVIIASLDEEYVVDVGMGSPRMRRPTPIDGTETAEDGATVSWRIEGNDRPQYRLTAEYQIGDGEWQRRHVFDPTPRDLSYFAASNVYLSTAPESPFRNTAIVSIDTETGWKDLKLDTFERVTRGNHDERVVTPEEWEDLLAAEFGLTLPE